jgi:hypothetical protein
MDLLPEPRRSPRACGRRPGLKPLPGLRGKLCVALRGTPRTLPGPLLQPRFPGATGAGTASAEGAPGAVAVLAPASVPGEVSRPNAPSTRPNAPSSSGTRGSSALRTDDLDAPLSTSAEAVTLPPSEKSKTTAAHDETSIDTLWLLSTKRGAPEHGGGHPPSSPRRPADEE